MTVVSSSGFGLYFNCLLFRYDSSTNIGNQLEEWIKCLWGLRQLETQHLRVLRVLFLYLRWCLSDQHIIWFLVDCSASWISFVLFLVEVKTGEIEWEECKWVMYLDVCLVWYLINFDFFPFFPSVSVPHHENLKF